MTRNPDKLREAQASGKWGCRGLSPLPGESEGAEPPQSRFAFDLDGTVSECEILPLLGRELGLEEELGRLTRLTLEGRIDFAVSFRLRFQMLRALPLERVRAVIARAPLNPHIAAFIARRRERCCIVTGNLDLWVTPILERLGCRAFCSSGSVRGGELFLDRILNKGEALRQYRGEDTEPLRIIAVGESAGDIPLFQEADLGVAFAGVHAPAPGLLPLAAHVADDGAALCELLGELEG